MRLSYIPIVLLVSLISCATAWDSDEFEIYDLVEEVNQINQNFYEYMEITPEATTSEIRKAYRKLRNNEPLTDDDEDALIDFVDRAVICTLNPELAAKMVNIEKDIEYHISNCDQNSSDIEKENEKKLKEKLD